MFGEKQGMWMIHLHLLFRRPWQRKEEQTMLTAMQNSGIPALPGHDLSLPLPQIPAMGRWPILVRLTCSWTYQRYCFAIGLGLA